MAHLPSNQRVWESSSDRSGDPDGGPHRSNVTVASSSQSRLVILRSVSFAQRIKEYRTTLFGKQSALAQAIGCSEAAISYWETGMRLPLPTTLTAIIAVLGQVGVPRSDLLELRHAWQNARSRHRGEAE